MDSERFDRLVRGFSQARSRRQALRGLAGTVAAGAFALGGREARGQDCKRNGKPCKKDRQCCSDNCVGGTGGKTNDGTCQDVSDECTGVADGTPCGSTGSGLRCCNEVCPPPCLPPGTCCDENTTCADCCGGAQTNSACPETGGISCGINPPRGECKGDAGCSESICVCDTCCRESGARCFANEECCSGTCNDSFQCA